MGVPKHDEVQAPRQVNLKIEGMGAFTIMEMTIITCLIYVSQVLFEISILCRHHVRPHSHMTQS